MQPLDCDLRQGGVSGVLYIYVLTRLRDLWWKSVGAALAAYSRGSPVPGRPAHPGSPIAYLKKRDIAKEWTAFESQRCMRLRLYHQPNACIHWVIPQPNPCLGLMNLGKLCLTGLKFSRVWISRHMEPGVHL